MSTPTMSTLTATTSRGVPATDRLDGLLAPGEPPRRAGPLTASGTFGWRAALKIRREPKQLTDSIAIPILFTVLFIYLFGGAIGGTPGHYLKTCGTTGPFRMMNVNFPRPGRRYASLRAGSGGVASASACSAHSSASAWGALRLSPGKLRKPCGMPTYSVSRTGTPAARRAAA
jgi:hypothetical protein